MSLFCLSDYWRDLLCYCSPHPMICTWASFFRKFHYNLGIILNSNCDENVLDVGDSIFIIASQINYGEEYIQKNRDMCIKVVELNMKAGKRALDGFNHKTAYSFLKTSLSLLPDDHWESYYQLSLRLSLLTARAAYSCSNFCATDSLLQSIFDNALSTKDKLPAYSLLGSSKFLFPFYRRMNFVSDKSAFLYVYYSAPNSRKSGRCCQFIFIYLDATGGNNTSFSYR